MGAVHRISKNLEAPSACELSRVYWSEYQRRSWSYSAADLILPSTLFLRPFFFLMLFVHLMDCLHVLTLNPSFELLLTGIETSGLYLSDNLFFLSFPPK